MSKADSLTNDAAESKPTTQLARPSVDSAKPELITNAPVTSQEDNAGSTERQAVSPARVNGNGGSNPQASANESHTVSRPKTLVAKEESRPAENIGIYGIVAQIASRDEDQKIPLAIHKPNSPAADTAQPVQTRHETAGDGGLLVDHLCVINRELVIYGIVVTSREALELPFRVRADIVKRLASQAEIAREIDLVKAMYIHGKNQAPSAFRERCKLYLREDIA